VDLHKQKALFISCFALLVPMLAKKPSAWIGYTQSDACVGAGFGRTGSQLEELCLCHLQAVPRLEGPSTSRNGHNRRAICKTASGRHRPTGQGSCCMKASDGRGSQDPMMHAFVQVSAELAAHRNCSDFAIYAEYLFFEGLLTSRSGHSRCAIGKRASGTGLHRPRIMFAEVSLLCKGHTRSDACVGSHC
jgi:hypothetical protein